MAKPLPSNKEAEIALLADIFLKNDILADCIGVLMDTDFHYKAHQIIFSRFMDMYKNNIPIDVLTFTNGINKEMLQSIGGVTYLSQIIASEVSVVNYKQYIKIIKNLSIKRNLIETCQEALNKAFDEVTSPKNIVDTIETNIINSASGFEYNKTLNAENIMEKTINYIEKGYLNGGKIPGISTGYKAVDEATGGLIKGDLMVIAARPSMGKTALVMNMLNKLPKENNALLFELEMTAEKLGVRMLAPKTLLNSKNLSRGKIAENDFNLIMKKSNEIVAKDNVFINCKAGLSVAEIKAEAKKIKIQHGLDVIFVDHIGKIRADNPKATRNDQVGQISQDLKNLAKDLDVCVIALSQLNRYCETRSDKHPGMSDLRDSGNVEQDADEILMLYRDDYYAERENRESKSPGTLEIMVAKNRDGEAGLLTLSYNTKYQIITEEPIYH